MSGMINHFYYRSVGEPPPQSPRVGLLQFLPLEVRQFDSPIYGEFKVQVVFRFFFVEQKQSDEARYA